VGAGVEEERPGGPEDWLIRRHESIEYGVLSIGKGNVSGGRWRPQGSGGGGIYSVLDAVLYAVIDSAIHSYGYYVVTRSRPYPETTRTVRGAVPT